MGRIALVRCVLVLRYGLAGVVWYAYAGWSCASCVRCGWCRAPSAPYTRPTQRLSRPPPIQKLGAENHTLQLNIYCSWWWTYVPETCRAKNTSIKLPSCIKLAFHFISWGKWTVKQPTLITIVIIIIITVIWPNASSDGVQISQFPVYNYLLYHPIDILYPNIQELPSRRMCNISGLYVTRLNLNKHFCLFDSPRPSLTASFFAAVLSICHVRNSPQTETILAAGSDPVMRQVLFVTVNIQPVLNIILADNTVYSCFCLCLLGQMFLI